jgi:hypothetical protein
MRYLLCYKHNPRTTDVERDHLNCDAIVKQNSDKFNPHLAEDISQHYLPYFQPDSNTFQAWFLRPAPAFELRHPLTDELMTTYEDLKLAFFNSDSYCWDIM